MKHAGDERRLVERQLLVALVEVQPRRGLDAVGAVSEVHLVAVDGEDFLLRVALLDLDREDGLADFPLERLLFGQAELVFQIAGELLCQRAGSLRAPPLHDIGQRRDRDPPDVHPEMAVEFRVFGRDDRLPQQRVDVVVADDDAPLRRELANQLSAGGIDPGDRAR